MTEFKVGDRVRHTGSSIHGAATILFTPEEIGRAERGWWGIRYDTFRYNPVVVSTSPDGIDYHVGAPEDLEIVEEVPQASITGEQQACIEAVLKAAFASQHKDDYQQGKIRLANEIADILGWEKSE